MSDLANQMPILKRRFETLEKEIDRLRSRSDWMLMLGIIVAFTGVFVYLIMLNDAKKEVSDQNESTAVELFLISRPIILMLFIETLAVFFLRQYRIIFNEYKDYYTVYMRLQKYLQLFDLVNDQGENDPYEKLRQELFETVKGETISFSQIHTDNHTLDPEFLKMVSKLKDEIDSLKKGKENRH